MPSYSAIIPVVTCASPSSLKRRRLSARTRVLVRCVRMALPSTRSAMMAASLSRRPEEPAVRVGERAVVDADAVAREHRRELRGALRQVAAGALVGVLADALPRRVTEYV